jgi:3-deoxy-manno-octulosonate cytidylyltransferase (CMP-KDO synthetase)
MIAWVHERAVRSEAKQVIIATDDERIAEACANFDARVELTAPDHESGTDRIAELARRFGWADDEIVVNVQGDEPLLPPALISQVATLLAGREDADVATLVTPLQAEEWDDPHVAKVVLARDGRALYFSRAPIPWPRDGVFKGGLRHIGIYAYRVAALNRLAATRPCELEQRERLEQLRALWLGMTIVTAEAREKPPPGVDTEEDLGAARRLLAGSANPVP